MPAISIEPKSSKDIKAVIRLEIPEDLLRSYEVDASFAAKSLESILVDRLKICKNHAAISPLYFDDSERQQLEKLLGHSVKNPREALDLLVKAQTVRVGPVDVELSVPLLKRLQTKTFGHSLQSVIERETVRGLEVQMGIR